MILSILRRLDAALTSAFVQWYENAQGEIRFYSRRDEWEHIEEMIQTSSIFTKLPDFHCMVDEDREKLEELAHAIAPGDLEWCYERNESWIKACMCTVVVKGEPQAALIHICRSFEDYETDLEDETECNLHREQETEMYAIRFNEENRSLWNPKAIFATLSALYAEYFAGSYQGSGFYCEWGFAVYSDRLGFCCEMHPEGEEIETYQDVYDLAHLPTWIRQVLKATKLLKQGETKRVKQTVVEFRPLVDMRYDQGRKERTFLHYFDLPGIEGGKQMECKTKLAGIVEIIKHANFFAWFEDLRDDGSKPTEISPLSVNAITKPPKMYRAPSLPPYTDKQGQTFPNDSVAQLITSANIFLKNGGGCKTLCKATLGKNVEMPQGLHLFQGPPISNEVKERALAEITQLFANPGNIPMTDNPPKPKPTNNILFWSHQKNAKQPFFQETMEILRARTPALAEYAARCCAAIMQLLGIDSHEMFKANLTLVHYDPGAGLNAHIDSVYQFDGTVGPICTIALGTGEKLLDMLPTLVDGRPTRIRSNPHQIVVMDGMSRVGWSHALPWGYDLEQWTLVFKFPGLRRIKHIEDFTYDGYSFQIPYYL